MISQLRLISNYTLYVHILYEKAKPTHLKMILCVGKQLLL
jgi:hypothetical protein